MTTIRDIKQFLADNPRLPDDYEVQIYMPDYGTILPASIIQNTGLRVVIYGYGQPGFSDKIRIPNRLQG